MVVIYCLAHLVEIVLRARSTVFLFGLRPPCFPTIREYDEDDRSADKPPRVLLKEIDGIGELFFEDAGEPLDER